MYFDSLLSFLKEKIWSFKGHLICCILMVNTFIQIHRQLHTLLQCTNSRVSSCIDRVPYFHYKLEILSSFLMQIQCVNFINQGPILYKLGFNLIQAYFYTTLRCNLSQWKKNISYKDFNCVKINLRCEYTSQSILFCNICI